jgi:hypothetical protein
MTALANDEATIRAAVWEGVRAANGQPFAASYVSSKIALRRGLISDYLMDWAALGLLTVTDRTARHGPLFKQAVDTPVAPPVPLPRPVPVAFYPHALELQIPASHDGLWSLIRWMGRAGPFALADLIAAVRGHIQPDDVRAFVRALERGGVLTPELAVPDKPRFRVDLRHVETPRLRPDGQPLQGPQRHALMWRSIKMLGLFTADNLAMAASLPDLAVTPAQAARYADDLTAGGYLISQSLKLYRLRPDMNTGPAAPRVLRARFIWDANLCRVMGASSIDEARS